MATANDIVQEAYKWVGVKYRHAGRNEQGVDCIGLIIKVAHNIGLTTYDTINYPKRPRSQDLLREMKDHLVRVPITDAKHGDIVVFNMGRINPVHCAIYDAEKQRVIHAYVGAKQVVEAPITADLWGKVHSCFRYAGLED